MLDLFNTFGIRATWAMVGFLVFDTYEELLEYLATQRPSYARSVLDPYRELSSLGRTQQTDPCHYGLSLIRKVQEHEAQEIATHTFSHYYCLEPGRTLGQSREDVRAAKRTAERLGIEICSIVFPRNQYSDEHPSVCKDLGIIAYRGNPASRPYTPRRRGLKSNRDRALLGVHTAENFAFYAAYSSTSCTFRKIGACEALPCVMRAGAA